MSKGSDLMIQKAKSLIGASESNGKAQALVMRPYNKLTGRSLNVKTCPWCQIFIVSCEYTSGAVKKGKYSKTSGCLQALNWYKQKKRFKKRGVTPSPSWQVFYDFKGNGKPTHTGVIVSRNTKKKTITVAEGNKSNKVAYRTISWNSKYIIGYGLPYYVA